jgi:glycosyltransferase involved in cell wall biosynthesis
MPNVAPLVSVAMITHNHERFISQAIESVLAQQTRFPLEVVVGDDASSDDTRRRIEVLRTQAPDVLRTLIRPANIGMHRNLEGVLHECRGEFIAFLEGDDYWTSPNKLQLQANVLGRRENAVGVFHRAVIVDAFGKESGRIWPEKASTEVGTRELLADHLPIVTASVMIRRAALVALPDSYRKLTMRDWPMWVFASLHGCWLYLPEVMAAYRVHDRGTWSSLSEAARLDSTINALRMFAADLPPPFPDVARHQLARKHLEAFNGARISGRPADARRHLREAICLFPHYRVTDAKRLLSASLAMLSPRALSRVRQRYERIGCT